MPRDLLKKESTISKNYYVYVRNGILGRRKTFKL
jgi:hypothetical protein